MPGSNGRPAQIRRSARRSLPADPRLTLSSPLNHEVFPGTEARGRIAWVHSPGAHSLPRPPGIDRVPLPQDIIARGASPQIRRIRISTRPSRPGPALAQPVSNVGDMVGSKGNLTYRQTANGFDISGIVACIVVSRRSEHRVSSIRGGISSRADAPAIAVGTGEDRSTATPATLPVWSEARTPSSDYYRPIGPARGTRFLGVNSGRTTLRWTFTPASRSLPDRLVLRRQPAGSRGISYFQSGGHHDLGIPGLNWRMSTSLPVNHWPCPPCWLSWFYDHRRAPQTPSPGLFPLFRPSPSPTAKNWHATIDSRADNRGDYFEPRHVQHAMASAVRGPQTDRSSRSARVSRFSVLAEEENLVVRPGLGMGWRPRRGHWRPGPARPARG